MLSRTTANFWKCFDQLPQHIQQKAREAFRTFKKDPYHKSLRFEKIHRIREVYSVRVSLGYRAVGVKEGEEITWHWIGSHADYDRLISKSQ